MLCAADSVEHDTPLGFDQFLVHMQARATKVVPIDLLVEEGQLVP
ncbi:MAG: hypothetical protein WAV54_00355 [Acidimicrobiales bacterium]